MGKIEQQLKIKIRKTKINSAIIGTIAVAGILSVGALAPNVLGAIGKKYLRQRKYQLKSSVSRLIVAGYIVLVEVNGKKQLQLTSRGERYAAQLQEGGISVKRPRRWDGKWRILMFDIPEKRRGVRTTVRHTLQALGFKRLQDSVWVHPHDCEDLITLLKVDFSIGKDLLYIIADTIEYDAPLRRHFGLPKDL